MAKAFAEGARSVPGTEAVLKRALDAGLDDLLGCDAVAFGSADYFSYIAGAPSSEALAKCKEAGEKLAKIASK